MSSPFDRRHSAPTVLTTLYQARHDSKIDLPPSPTPSKKYLADIPHNDPTSTDTLATSDAQDKSTGEAEEKTRAPKRDERPATFEPRDTHQSKINSKVEVPRLVNGRLTPSSTTSAPTELSALLTGPTVPIVVANETIFPSVPVNLLIHFSRRAAYVFTTLNVPSMTFNKTDISVLKYIIHHLIALCSASASSSPEPHVYSGHLDKMLAIYQVARNPLDIPTIWYPLRRSIMHVLHQWPLNADALRFIMQHFGRQDQLVKVAINKTIDFRMEGWLPDAQRIDEYLAERPELEAHFVEMTERKMKGIRGARERRRVENGSAGRVERRAWTRVWTRGKETSRNGQMW